MNDGDQALNDSEEKQDAEVGALLAQAREAYEADDSAAVSQLCDQVLAADPENPGAWSLLARFGGWDSKMLDFDLDLALKAAYRALNLVPDERRYEEASDIYAARKRQISARLEAALLMPSYTGAKEVHAIMMDWERLLRELPDLSPELIESEVTLCTNLCLRSKMGIMPSDRLVYTAYASFNGKEPYGETFRRALAARIGERDKQDAEAAAAAQKRAEEKLSSYEERRASGDLTADAEKSLIKNDIAELIRDKNDVEGRSGKRAFLDQMAELKRQRAALKPYKFFQKKEIDQQIAALETKVAQIDEQVARESAALQAQIEVFQARLADER